MIFIKKHSAGRNYVKRDKDYLYVILIVNKQKQAILDNT